MRAMHAGDAVHDTGTGTEVHEGDAEIQVHAGILGQRYMREMRCVCGG